MRKAFTLIELLVVIAIIGVIASIATVALQSAQGKARDGKRVSDVKQVQKALELYFNERAGYPGDGNLHAGAGDGYLILGEDTTMLSGGNGFAEPVGGVLYVQRIPKDPTPGLQYRYLGMTNSGADCAATSISSPVCPAYRIDFTLEKGVTGLPGLNCTASPSGLTCS